MKCLATILALLLPPGSLCACGADSPVFSAASLVWQEGQPVPAVLPGLTKEMTLAIRVRDVNVPADLVSWPADGGRTALRARVEDGGSPSLIVEVSTDARPSPLRMAVPLAVIGADKPHVVVLRYLGHRAELFVDGVLVDEDWPMGALLSADGPMKITGPVSRVAMWNRDLSDDELQSVSGDREGLAERDNRYLGRPTPVGQYWRPRGLNTYAGDCMPFFHQGRFHLFYLFDRHHHGSKWGLGAHQWAHASTTDLVNWEQHPLAIPVTDEREGSICTGSTFFHDGTYYAFYAVRSVDGSPASLNVAVSRDGIQFAKQPPIGRLSDAYNAASARDPVVFFDAGSGLFHMLVTTSLREPAVAGRGGCLAQLVSRDLKKWEEREPFLVPGYPGEPECPDYFEWHGWYYLVFSNQAMARYRMSRQPLGPWLRPKVDIFDGPQAAVMKTAAFTGDRRLGAAFLSAGGYAGDVVFREIIQHDDGTLGTKWPGEMIPRARETQAGPAVKLNAPQDLQAVDLGEAPKDFLLRARVTPAADASFFGIRFGAGEKMQGGFEVRFEPLREKVGLRHADAGSNDESEHSAIYDVVGIDRPFDLELLVKGEIVDVCVDHRRTLVARIPTSNGDLFAFAQNAEVAFEKPEVSAISENETK
ncbi:MAG TPA: hypothetical protein VG826_06930 [Pirellulales bacterium]|nr:hypothetical protein [Pirellulales bacterium]